MIVATDWTINRTTKVISYIGNDHSGGSPSYATVIEFHRWLQSLADDAAAVPVSGDELDITNVDPSRRSTDNIITLINGYTIGDTEAEHLYDGSIILSDGNTIYDGIVNFGNPDVQIQIIQNGIVVVDDWWNFNGGGLNANATAGISHRFMIKTRTGGVDIDGRRLVGIARRFGYTYSEFRINGTSRGNNVLALSDSPDLNNPTSINVVSGWTEIYNISPGYVSLDVDDNGSPEYYYSQWTKSGYTINQFYERMKYLTRDGASTPLYGLAGELFRGITHQIGINGISGTFDEENPVSWSGGTGQVLASNDSSTIWIQLLTGVAPSTGEGISQSSPNAASAIVGVVVDRVSTLTFPFIGASTGSAIIGGYGVGVKILNLSSSDKMKDLSTNVITPPNYVTNTVASIVSGEDYVIVAPWSGATDTNGDPAIWKNQLLLQTPLTTNNITNVVVTTTIPSDTPATGTIRVTDDNGFERRLTYSGWTNSTFDITTTDGQEDFASVNASAGRYVYITYIDKLADSTTATFTGVQAGSRNLVVIVRDGKSTPIKQFISSWSYSTSNQTINAIRTTDV